MKKLLGALAQWVVCVAVIAGVIAGLLSLSSWYFEDHKNYGLHVYVLTPQGPAEIDKLAAKNVTHQPDGSICFTDSEGQKGCIKTDMYILKEMSVE